jgi:hypothetical protein
VTIGATNEQEADSAIVAIREDNKQEQDRSLDTGTTGVEVLL